MPIVVITGVSRGLGRAMAVEFARQDCTVFGSARSAEPLETLQQDLGPPHQFRTLDIADDQAVKSWSDAVLREADPPDFLINNAAVINSNAPLWQVPAEEFDRLTAVNINGIANTIRHFVPAMIAKGSGTIVNFSSGWGRSTSPDVAPYCATKWAVEGMTQALADELPAGIAAIPLNPGIINTDMLQSCFGSGADAYLTADQWAKVAVPFILNLTEHDSGRSLTVPGM